MYKNTTNFTINVHNYFKFRKISVLYNILNTWFLRSMLLSGSHISPINNKNKNVLLNLFMHISTLCIPAKLSYFKYDYFQTEIFALFHADSPQLNKTNISNRKLRYSKNTKSIPPN